MFLQYFVKSLWLEGGNFDVSPNLMRMLTRGMGACRDIGREPISENRLFIYPCSLENGVLSIDNMYI